MSSLRSRHPGVLIVALTVAAAAAGIAGCGDSTPSASDAKSKTGGSASGKTVLMVSGPLSDPFFSAVKKGATAAAQDLKVKFEYMAPANLSNPGPDMARTGDSALARKPDAIVVSDFLPDAQNDGIKRMVASGIPVFASNAGPDWEALGIDAFVGEDPTLVGQDAGKRFAAAGGKTGLCVSAPGNPTLEARCKGFDESMKQAGGTTTVLSIPFEDQSNPTAVKSAIQGALRAHPEIDTVFTLGSATATLAIDAVAANGKGDTIKVGTCDLSKPVLTAVQGGKLLFAVDQQPYLQGYYGVLMAAQAAALGMQPIGEVRTAPLFVTKDNVAKVIESNSNNAGIRGAS